MTEQHVLEWKPHVQFYIFDFIYFLLFLCTMMCLIKLNFLIDYF